MRKLMLCIFFVIAPSQAYSQLISGQVTMQQDHFAWSSFILVADKQAVARSMTMDLSRFNALMIDYHQPDCSARIDFINSMDRPVVADNYRRDLLISLRADSGTRFDLPGFSQLTMGDTHGRATIAATDRFHDLIKELERGVSLRAKFMFGGEESTAAYFTYSLRGFTAAHRRARSLCETVSRKMPRPSQGYTDRL